MSRGSKPGERRGGRKRGTPNKLSGDVKAMVLAALEEKGGIAYLAEKAESHPQAFMSLLGRILPTTMANDPENPLLTGLTVTFVKPD